VAPAPHRSASNKQNSKKSLKYKTPVYELCVTSYELRVDRGSFSTADTLSLDTYLATLLGQAWELAPYMVTSCQTQNKLLSNEQRVSAHPYIGALKS